MTEHEEGHSLTRFSYLYDPGSSVSLLLDSSSGIPKESYGYTAYGSANSSLSKKASGFSTGTVPTNPVRFQGKRFDSGSGSYDMGARRYSPSTGRWLRQDFYYDALDNLGLSQDPLTANRYAFLGANPVNYVEFDGHTFTVSGGGGAPVDGPQGPQTPDSCYRSNGKTYCPNPVQGAEEDDLFFDIAGCLIPGGFIKLAGKKGGKRLSKKAARWLAGDLSSAGIRRASFRGVEVMGLSAKWTKIIAGDVGRDTPQRYGMRVHDAFERNFLKHNTGWRREYDLGDRRNFADLIKIDNKTKTATIIDIKRNDPREMRRGLRQLKRYRREFMRRNPEFKVKIGFITYVRP